MVHVAFKVAWVKLRVENVTTPVELAFTICELLPQPLTVAVTDTTVAPGL
jgi:hypothetical protein